MNSVQEKIDGLAARYADGTVYSLDGISAESPTGTSTSAASNTEPMLRLNLEATTQTLMEDEAGRGARLHPELIAVEAIRRARGAR